MPRSENTLDLIRRTNPEFASKINELIEAAITAQTPSASIRCPNCSFEVLLGVISPAAAGRGAARRRGGRRAAKAARAGRPARAARPARRVPAGPNVGTLAAQVARKRKTITGRVYADLSKAMNQYRNLPKDELRKKKMQWLREQL